MAKTLTPSRKAGLLSRMWNKTKEMAGIEPKRTLKPPTDWTEYVLAVNIIHEAATAKKTKIYRIWSVILNPILGKKDCPVPTLTLAAYMCNLECQKLKQKDLRKLILEHISEDTRRLVTLGISTNKVKIGFKGKT